MDGRYYSKEFMSQFIELYKSLPTLWKIKSKEYTDRRLKDEAYQLMVKKLKQVEPNATRELVIKKINSLRSSRRKERKKVLEALKSGEAYQPSLWYYEILDFVDDQETARCSEVFKSNFHDIESEGNNDEETAWQSRYIDTESNVDEPSASGNSNIEYQPTPQLSTMRMEWNEDGNTSSTTKALQPVQGQKRGSSEVDDPLSFTRKRLIETNEDKHDVFGRNVACKLRCLPNNQRIFLEKMINDAIFEAELGNLNRNCYVHVPGVKESQPVVLKFEQDDINSE